MNTEKETCQVRVYKYRAYPSESQKEAYDKQAAGVRQAYNELVSYTSGLNEENRKRRASGRDPLPLPWTPQKSLSPQHREFQATLSAIRSCMTFRWRGGEFPMREVSSSAISAAIGELRQAWAAVHERRKAGLAGGVRYRRRDDAISLQTCSGTGVPDPVIRSVRGDFAWVKLPACFGGAWKVRYHRPLPEGRVNLVRVRRSQAGCDEIMITVTTPGYRRPGAMPGTSAGADRGVNLQLCLSDGRYSQTPGLNAAERRKHLELEQQLARQRRRAKAEHAVRCTIPGCRRKWHPSNRYLKTRAALRKLDATAGNRMRDHLHKVTRMLADEYETIVFEDLNLRGMTRSARGTEQEPGRNVAAKSGLNRELLAANLGAIPVLAAQKGARIVSVSPVNTSRHCPRCGSTEAANRSSTRFLCIACGYAADADVNAAVNIRERWSGAQEACGRSQAAQGKDSEKERQGFLVPDRWGRATARNRLQIRRSERQKSPRPVITPGEG